jgi:hypothetical protein
MSNGLVKMAQDEVVALHEFFVRWMRQGSEIPIDFSVCEDALATDFEMVTPAGVVSTKATLIDRLKRARWSLPPDFAIDVVDAQPIWLGRREVLLKYVERQRRLGQITRRRSCALLTREAEAPRGMLWRYVQETWMTDDQGI